MAEINLRPTRVRINTVQGADIPLNVIIADQTTNDPIDITGWVFTMAIKTANGATNQTLTNGSGITIVNALNGQLTLSVEGSLLVFTGNCEVTLYGTLWAVNSENENIPYVQFLFVIAGENTASTCCQSGECLGGDITVQVGGTDIELLVNACLPITPESIIEALNGLDEYDSDESAIADGLTTNDIYWQSELSTLGLAGFLKRIT